MKASSQGMELTRRSARLTPRGGLFGSQDAWDIAQLLHAPEPARLVAEVETARPAPADDARGLWARIVRDARS